MTLANTTQLADAWVEIGNERVAEGRYTEAEALFDKAAALGYPGAIFSRSHCRLMRGDVAGYLADYERRWEVPTYREQYGRPWHDDVRLWQGEPVNGTLLIHGEQGIGDILQAMRYLRHIEWRADRVVFEVRQELVRLAEAAFPKLEVVRRGDALPHFRAHLPTGSLAHVVVTPWRDCYLDDIAPPRPLPNRIGLCWAGSRLHPRDAERSIPAELLRPLMQGEWVNLTQELAPVGTRAVSVVYGDMLDTARQIASSSLVISCDTAVAHLAGALGVPCWLLLSDRPDPRWGLQSETTPLYPNHRLFRQKERGNWQEVITRVTAELETQHNGN